MERNYALEIDEINNEIHSKLNIVIWKCNALGDKDLRKLILKLYNDLGDIEDYLMANYKKEIE